MTEFENLKRSYINAIQGGFVLGISSHDLKQGNEVLHRFCTVLIENSNYSAVDKQQMKNEIDQIKECLSVEIAAFFCNNNS